jgi:hypothetical protein
MVLAIMHVEIKRHSERNGAHTIAVYIAGNYQWSDARAVGSWLGLTQRAM